MDRIGRNRLLFVTKQVRVFCRNHVVFFILDIEKEDMKTEDEDNFGVGRKIIREKRTLKIV